LTLRADTSVSSNQVAETSGVSVTAIVVVAASEEAEDAAIATTTTLVHDGALSNAKTQLCNGGGRPLS
jgi:hypothetical protein